MEHGLPKDGDAEVVALFQTDVVGDRDRRDIEREAGRQWTLTNHAVEKCRICCGQNLRRNLPLVLASALPDVYGIDVDEGAGRRITIMRRELSAERLPA